MIVNIIIRSRTRRRREKVTQEKEKYLNIHKRDIDKDVDKE